AEVKLPLMALRQLLILVSSTTLPVLFLINSSRNMMVEVMSHTSELTHPPLLQGEATTIGTLYPSPIGLSLGSSGSIPFFAISCSKLAYSSEVSNPLVKFLVSFGLGATKGGIWSK